jgi:hypothetical protein
MYRFCNACDRCPNAASTNVGIEGASLDMTAVDMTGYLFTLSNPIVLLAIVLFHPCSIRPYQPLFCFIL